MALDPKLRPADGRRPDDQVAPAFHRGLGSGWRSWYCTSGALAAPLLAPYSPMRNDAGTPCSARVGRTGGTDSTGATCCPGCSTAVGTRWRVVAATFCTVVIGTVIGALARSGGLAGQRGERVLEPCCRCHDLGLLVIVTVFGTGAGVIVLAVTVVYARRWCGGSRAALGRGHRRLRHGAARGASAPSDPRPRGAAQHRSTWCSWSSRCGRPGWCC